ncbi:MAG: ATP-binding protein [Candidatus Parabeggiatoa sp. nov. 3]|nr:MAG: ATP-binding protein [Gammaproteobacteria bacterium]RKZ67419.1 MAG: ATP-binding protein [Gammaproteobacteria bacterium]RKZ89151.1 MAG: ATP-binding protein [Gammaproteobacteria bacterium]HEW98485.1 ATP-binding protein [Beggiatoa sp.]
MLIEFNVTNFRSIQGTQTLSLAADSTQELQDENTFSLKRSTVPRLVKSAAIYGANAAGKSNLIRAIAFMHDFVKNSAKNCEDDEPINIKPFLLKPNQSPSEFEAIFIKDGVQYQYGFALTSECVKHEWLFVNEEQWLERIYDPETQHWFISDQLISGMDLREQWQAATHYKALFLSTAKMLNSEQHSQKLKSIFDWFTQTLTVFNSGSDILNSLTLKQCLNTAHKQKIVSFLASADLNIVDLRVENQLNAEKDLLFKLPLEMREQLGKRTIKFLHHEKNTNNAVPFDADDESEGTRKLFALAGPLIDILEKGHILVVDELNNSLHPTLMQFLIRLFHNQSLNKRGAQLIFTTHDSSILDQTLLRRDQIWLIEKDSEQATQLYPLTDFKPRQNEAWQRDYLEGRYGALPSIVELTFNGN